MYNSQDTYEKDRDDPPIYKCPKCGQFCTAETGYTELVKNDIFVVYCSEQHSKSHRKQG